MNIIRESLKFPIYMQQLTDYLFYNMTANQPWCVYGILFSAYSETDRLQFEVANQCCMGVTLQHKN